MKFENAKKLISSSQKICVIQAENPDGDSLGSALALEEILSDLGKSVKLFCPVDIPKYLRYFSGWDRIEGSIYEKFDLLLTLQAIHYFRKSLKTLFIKIFSKKLQF